MVINPIVGVYIPIIRIPIKGGMTIPNIRSLDPGTYTTSIYIVMKKGVLVKCQVIIYTIPNKQCNSRFRPIPNINSHEFSGDSWMHPGTNVPLLEIPI